MAGFLVVDDDGLTVRGMTGLLNADGHDVAPFTAGAHAVEAISRESFDAVVTDLDTAWSPSPASTSPRPASSS